MAVWTPSEITTALWLDAADSSTITLDSGKVSQWADKSGNSRHVAQAVADARPVVSAAAQNGLDVVTFDGGDMLVTSANFPETGDAEFSVFWVHTKTTDSAGCVFGWGDTGTSLGAFGLLDDNTNVGMYYAGGNAYKTAAISSGYNAWSYVKAPGAINSTSVLTKNGTAAGSSGHSTSAPNISSQPFSVGSWANYASNKLIGSVAELIICPSALSETDRQIIEGYLAHKWGLAASLPSDHPYKSEAPETAEPSSLDGEVQLPAIRVSGGMATDGEIALPFIQIYGDFAMDGAISLPLLAIAGKTQDFINGEVRLHGFQIDSEIGVSSRIDSDIAIPFLTISGDMQADGEIRLHLLSISGAMQQQGVASGEIALPRLAVSGSIDVTTWMAGGINIPAMTISGAMEAVAAGLSGDIFIPLLTVSGAMSPASSNDFGTETDRVLRYASSRRHI